MKLTETLPYFDRIMSIIGLLRSEDQNETDSMKPNDLLLPMVGALLNAVLITIVLAFYVGEFKSNINAESQINAERAKNYATLLQLAEVEHKTNGREIFNNRTRIGVLEEKK